MEAARVCRGIPVPLKWGASMFMWAREEIRVIKGERESGFLSRTLS